MAAAVRSRSREEIVQGACDVAQFAKREERRDRGRTSVVFWFWSPLAWCARFGQKEGPLGPLRYIILGSWAKWAVYLWPVSFFARVWKFQVAQKQFFNPSDKQFFFNFGKTHVALKPWQHRQSVHYDASVDQNIPAETTGTPKHILL